ncbi:TPA: LPXTG cell wall anchor domain-containing protein [Enterococcus faecalis]|nr:LPXTG cell wall anchor domain-containing protein [Enterococcus faecalis]
MKLRMIKCVSTVLLIMSGNLFSTKVFASETANSDIATSETANSDTATSETVNSDTVTFNETNQKSYAEKNYDSLQMNSKPVDENNVTKDKDKDGKLTYITEINGYVPKTTEVIEEGISTGNGKCVGDKITKTYNDEVDLNAKSIMDTNLDDYSNNGYLEKVKNPNNHPIGNNSSNNESLYGPGNLEVQHWQTGSNESTKTQNWRILFATDYAINNARLTVTLPYNQVTTTDVTDWVINRYYPAVTNNNNLYTNSLVPLDISFEGNIAIINFGNIVGYSAFGMIFSKTFDIPQDFSNDLKVTTARVTGTWKSDELTASSKYVKSSKTEPLITWTNEVCPIPINPNVPDTPDMPDTPDTPDTPDMPDTPDTPDISDMPDTPDITGTQNKVTSLNNKITSNSVDKNTIKTANSNNIGALPKTGETATTNIMLSVLGVLTVLGSVIILKKRI